MKGALVFLTVFVVFVVITLFVPSLPPGSQIYYSVGGVNVNYAILGITVPRLVPAVFNGVIYGVIAWLIYEVYCWITEKNKKTQKTWNSLFYSIYVEPHLSCDFFIWKMTGIEQFLFCLQSSVYYLKKFMVKSYEKYTYGMIKVSEERCPVNESRTRS